MKFKNISDISIFYVLLHPELSGSTIACTMQGVAIQTLCNCKKSNYIYLKILKNAGNHF